jgi:tellurite resistance protein TerC
MQSIGTPFMWGIFTLVVLVMLAIDLFLVGGGKRHRVSIKEAATWSVIWVSVSLLFAGALWWYLEGTAGPALARETSLEFLTGYLIEKSLAVDNVFLWLMLFSAFGVPVDLQRRVLIYGVIGAILMRTVMIFAGAALIAQFHWILYIFGAFLLYTGVKMFWFADEEVDLEKSTVVRYLRRHMNITTRFHGEQFFVVENGVRYATPLFLALVMVEFTDLVFAVDSIPAVFAITTDPFVVLTSNVFAILGLRAMYFLLGDAADRFSLLKYGLAMVLMFIGVKMLLIDVYKIPVGFSLAVVATLIGASMWLSLKHDAKRRAEAESLTPES